MKEAVTCRHLAVVVVIIIVVEWSMPAVDAMQCLPCYDPTTGDYVGPSCPTLPSRDDPVSCEPTYRHCSCCLECAGRVGDVCHQMTPP